MSGALASLSRYKDSDSEPEASSDVRQDHVASTSVATAAPQPCEGATSVMSPPRASSANSSNKSKRKLPPLEDSSLGHAADEGPVGSGPEETGNHRKSLTRGDWLCYCFVEVLVQPPLTRVIQDSHAYIQEKLRKDVTLIDLQSASATSNAGSTNIDEAMSEPATSASVNHLHVSLTRPFTVRNHEKAEYVRIATAAVERQASTTASFPFSFSRFAYLANDDVSRHFVVLEVGAGREKLHKLSTALSTELRSAFRARSYYEEARFHASTACLATPKLMSDQGVTTARAKAGLGPRLEGLIADVENRWGKGLRKCPPNWATRIGIQVGNKTTYIDL